MSEMDLIPSDYRQCLRIRRWCRKFLIIYALLVSGIALARIGLAQGVSRERAQVQELQSSKQLTLNQLSAIQRLHARKAEAQKRLEILHGLRGGPAAQEMFVMIDRALGQGVWFQSWSFGRAGEFVEVEPQTLSTGYFILLPAEKKQNQHRAWRVQTQMAIKGQARSHSALADFVKRLMEQPKVEDVRVLSTALRRYTTTQVVDFDLAVFVNSHPEA